MFLSLNFESKIANYLTERFIGTPSDFPQNECMEEAKQIHALYLTHPIQVKPEGVCPECEGDSNIFRPEIWGGNFPCPTCKGTGRLPAVTMTLEEIIREKVK